MMKAGDEKHADPPLAPGLYLVATPIGNLEDITLRALRVLRSCDRIACEDTRQTQKLLNHFRIATPTVSYHRHNESSRAAELIAQLQSGARIAVVSDAGTPGISDPGAEIAAAAIDAGIPVFPIPGANAALAALIASGLLGAKSGAAADGGSVPGSKHADSAAFTFHGFLPAKEGQRRTALEAVAESQNRVPHISQRCGSESPAISRTAVILSESRSAGRVEGPAFASEIGPGFSPDIESFPPALSSRAERSIACPERGRQAEWNGSVLRGAEGPAVALSHRTHRVESPIHIFYEAPHRILATLADIEAVFGPAQHIVLARELTKLHEEFLRGPVSDLRKALSARASIKGEFVLLLTPGQYSGFPTSLGDVGDSAAGDPAGCPTSRRDVGGIPTQPQLSIAQAVRALMQSDNLSEMDALKRVARARGLSKSAAYREWQRSKGSRSAK